jgi:hypothetical protein
MVLHFAQAPLTAYGVQYVEVTEVATCTTPTVVRVLQ